MCQLCGEGFIDWKALRAHADSAHGGWAEVRKRIFWHAEQMSALPLSMQCKRNLLANFDCESGCSRPGGTGELEPRQDIACVACARKDLLEHRYPVYLWKALPSGGGAVREQDEDDAGDMSDVGADENAKSKQPSCLKGSDGVFHFGDPHEINKLLAVEAHHELSATVPLEELHAPSIQHP